MEIVGCEVDEAGKKPIGFRRWVVHNNTDVGTATVIVDGIGSFISYKTATFEIVKGSVSTDVNADENADSDDAAGGTEGDAADEAGSGSGTDSDSGAETETDTDSEASIGAESEGEDPTETSGEEAGGETADSGEENTAGETAGNGASDGSSGGKTETGTTENADSAVGEDSAQGFSFTDDTGTGTWAWASDYIYLCYEKGIITGYGDGTFLPDNSLTRAEAATIIARTYGLTSDADASTFADVADDYWALQYIEACVEAGIINGYEDGTFRASQNVTRAELAKMIAVAEKLDLTAAASTFSDVSDSYWGTPYIEACAAAGIVTGYADGTFLAGSCVTRAEAAAMIARTF